MGIKLFLYSNHLKGQHKVKMNNLRIKEIYDILFAMVTF